ncbi:hypothetical protein BOTBODRAFT_60565 [Botryobasidium botryosum FD-172 SS1]|uniref:Protein kinase domain-containing protein n=1 Tax=Botryobasidium botryosum (strain FD-172 SS1) TaxID=930990 RepID=A0A067M4I9_BOTB1|nr:hypothetical protein BOTBODRAFT_60565 [Botryobasidium botryosum FD-172 SS1]
MEEVFKAINENWKPEDELTLAPVVNKFIELLTEIRTSIETYASYNCFDSFIHQFNIADDVEAKLKRLDYTLASFGVLATAVTQGFAAARGKDSSDVEEALKGQMETRNLTKENRAALDKVLGGLQTLLRQQAPGPAQEQTKSRILAIQSMINVGLPETKLLSGIECQKIGSGPVVVTSACEIWKGLWMGQQKVMVKVLRQSSFNESERSKRLDRWERRMDIWSKLHSEYILPLYGICYDDGPFPYLVLPWCPHGEANRYLKDKPAVERLKICLDAARGLQYLHSLEQLVIYGTMRGSGILISNDGKALLADFGVPSATDILSSADGRVGNNSYAIHRWMAPEMQNYTNTKSTDIWSWGMTTVELVSGKQPMQPFPSHKMPGTVMFKIAQGERPSPKEHDSAVLRGELWSLLQSCWYKDPEERPNVDVVAKKMEAIVEAYRRA